MGGLPTLARQRQPILVAVNLAVVPSSGLFLSNQPMKLELL